MMGFSSIEILNSVLFAVIYGAFFAFIYESVRLALLVFKSLPKVCSEILVFEKIFPTPPITKAVKSAKTGRPFSFFSVLAFFFGFSVISYISLDGDIRLYMLILSSASFFLFYSTFWDFYRWLILSILDLIFIPLSVFFRCLLIPFKCCFIFFKYKFARKYKYILDKSNKK